jgi:hypothetical protein
MFISQTHKFYTDVPLDINNWPTRSEAAKEAVKKMQMTHKVRPLQAYGVDGRLINPRDYKTRLQGSLVEMRFTLTHWAISPTKHNISGSDAFVADIQGLRIIQDPAPSPQVSPSKKRRRISDPFDEDSEDEGNKRWKLYD